MVFNFQCAAKLSVIVVLFALCFAYFTLPSLKEYMAQQIIVTTSEEKVNEVLAPAVTVCALNPRVGIDEIHKAFQIFCANVTDVRKCFDNATFNFSSTIVNATKGYSPYDSSLMNPSLWFSEVTLPSAGKCYTLNTSLKLEQDFMTGTIRLMLKRELNYWLFIHDINYFVQNQNPFGVPVNFRAVGPGQGWNKVYKFRTVKRKNIKNCNSDPSYKFTACVRSSLSKTAGCRLPWDPWTDQAVTVCTTMEQLR